MNFTLFLNKLWRKLSESRWTVLYITMALFQLLVSVGLEAVIFGINEDHAQYMSQLSSKYDSVIAGRTYQDYNYDKYSKQFVSITHGNVWYMVFEAYILFLCIDGLFFQNTIEIIGIALINILLNLFNAVQVYQSIRWINRINTQIAADNVSFPTASLAPLTFSVRTWEIVLLLVMVIFSASSVYLGYKLYQQFGWNIYKKIGANIKMQAMYRTYLVFAMILKLDIFFLMGFQILNLVFLFGDPSSNTHTIIYQCIIVAIVIPMVVLAVWGVRTENVPAMFVFALMIIATIVNFLYILSRFIISRDETLLTLLDFLGIALCIISLIVAYLAVLNFDLGLKEHFEKKYESQVDLNLEGIQVRKNRFSIDD